MKLDCFKAYDVRGRLPDQLNEEVAYRIGRAYADDKGQLGRDAASLKQGTLLHVGAMRYAFFVVEPWRQEGEYGTPLRPRQMEVPLERALKKK